MSGDSLGDGRGQARFRQGFARMTGSRGKFEIRGRQGEAGLR